MEILIGIMLAGVTEIIKELTATFGKKTTTAIVYGVVFLLALGYSYLQYLGFFNSETWAMAIKIFSGAVATYEVLIKRFIQPVLGYKK